MTCKTKILPTLEKILSNIYFCQDDSLITLSDGFVRTCQLSIFGFKKEEIRRTARSPMDSHYDKKEHHRRKELNKQRNLHRNTDRKCKTHGNKISKLVCENMYDFNPDNNVRDSRHYLERIGLSPATSVTTDDGIDDYVEYQAQIPQENENAINLEFSAITTREPLINEMFNLAQWIAANMALPPDRRYRNSSSMKNKCRQAIPVVDETILQDLKQIFPDLFMSQLAEVVRCCQKLPFRIRDLNHQLNERAKEFMSNYQLTEQQLVRVNRIGKKILFRSSYGVLFLQGNKFFAKRNHNNNQRRSTIKGYPMLKSTGELEHPWETAVRLVEQKIQYWDNENEEWKWFDMNGFNQENERHKYLECLITSVENTEFVRYIGLFIIRLKPDVEIRSCNDDQASDNENWHSIDENVQNRTFYSINPFLKYVQDHPNFA